MVQMTKKSIKKRRGTSITCLLLLCGLLFGTVIFLTANITDDKYGTKRRFSLPWNKQQQNGDNIFRKLLQALEKSRNNKKKRQNAKALQSEPFDRDSTMTLKHVDYSHIGGPQVGGEEDEPYPAQHIENFKGGATAGEKDEESSLEVVDEPQEEPEAESEDKTPKEVVDEPQEKPEAESEDQTPKEQESSEESKEEDSFEESTKPKETKPKEETVKKSEDVMKPRNKPSKNAESNESKASSKKSKKAAPAKEGKVPVPVSAPGEIKEKKSAEKKSGSSKQSKKSGGGGGMTTSGSTEKTDKKPKDGSSTGDNKNNGSKKSGENKVNEGPKDGERIAQKS